MKKINGNTKQQAIDLAYKMGFESEASKTNCAQATFHSVTAVLGKKSSTIFKSVYSLAGGGASSTHGSCGALLGALVVFGWLWGRTYEQWEEGKRGAKSQKPAQVFFDKFKGKFGTLICREIHQQLFGHTFDFQDPKDREKFERMGGHSDKCPTVVGLSSAWAVETMWEHLSPDQD